MILLMPKQPVLDWIQCVDPEPLQLTLAQLCEDQDAFLIEQDSVRSSESAQRWVWRRWKTFFEQYLYDWFTDESYWPQNRSLKMFKEWFDIQFHSMVWDLSSQPILHEDWDRDDNEYDKPK